MQHAPTLVLLLLILVLWGGTASAAASWVWFEAEKPVKTNFPAHTGFSADTFYDTKDEVLSGGNWLTSEGRRGKGQAERFAQYDVTVREDGTYELWARKFWKHGPFRWRFDQGEWKTCGSDVALADNTDIRQFLCVNWVYLGTATLKKGKHSFELRLLAKEGEETVACFDAFILTKEAFMPNGRLKPGEGWNLAKEGWFSYEPGVDPLREDSVLDLRWLNEPAAGEKGFVRREGKSFVLADGRPVRFWSVNMGNDMAAQNRTALAYMARKLAKLGVNMVRIHGPAFSGTKPNTKVIDNTQFLVSALKKEGIYTSLSFYFPLWYRVTPSDGIGGYESIGNKQPFAVIYYNQKLRSMYQGWMKALLAGKNPYGPPLGQEPAVVMTELVNEDSFFFWTFGKGNIPAAHWSNLEQLFGKWLSDRYGSLDKAFAVWPKAKLPQDDAAKGIAGVYESWDMTKDGSRSGGADKTKRVGDQVRFLAEVQRGFYESSIKYAREELGARNLFSCSNWTVTDGPTLDAIERWTYTVGDVIDRHGYYEPKHEGEGASYSVREGHTIVSASGLRKPEGLPIQVFQVADYPHIISELGWTQPNRFRAEWAFLSAAYGALQGLDGLYHFAVGSPFLVDTSINKFQIASPAVIGTFPANALLYRLGYVAEGKEALHQVVRLDDLFAMKGTGASTASALDELRKKDIPKGGESVGTVTRFDPLTFYVGPVVREFGDDPQKSRSQNLPDFIDRANKVVTSNTGELQWRYGQGLATVNTPFAQGATGFLASAGTLEFGDVSIMSGNEYASILAVSLDGKPLADSKRILVQTMTEDEPYGWEVADNRITSMGRAPFNVKGLDATVRFKGDSWKDAMVQALDFNGYRAGKPKPLDPGGVRIGTKDIYTVIER